jgi:uncharacterized protein
MAATRVLALTSLALLWSVSIGATGLAASFNCKKAEAADEKAICADRELDDEDVEMSVLYTQ